MPFSVEFSHETVYNNSRKIQNGGSQMCTQAQLHTILSTVYQKSVAEFGGKLDEVILYGSYARGDYDSESDIDIMVRVRLDKLELEKHRWSFSCMTSELSLENNITVSVRLQDYDTFHRYKEVLPFYMNVIKDGVNISA